MPIKSKKPLTGSLHTSRASYHLWADTVNHFSKLPRNLPKPKDELSNLEKAEALVKEHRSDLVQLWEAFTTERAEVSRYLMDPKREALVYLLGFHLANQARSEGVLQRVEKRSGLFSFLAKRSENLSVSGAELQSIQILDLGCGTGALSLSLVDTLKKEAPRLPLAVELVDKSQAFLDVAAHGIGRLAPGLPLVTRRQKLDEYLSRELHEGPKSGRWIWYQLGYVWNEISHNPKTSQLLLRFLEAGLSRGQRIISLIEPANQDISRNAQALRDELLNRGYRVLYPCPRQDSCPMLERSRDWCYSEFVWERPPLAKVVDRILKIDRHRIGCSAYVFVSPDVALALEAHRARRSEEVVVGRPLTPSRNQSSREFEYLLCTETGLVKQKPQAHPSGEKLELLRGQTLAKPLSDGAPQKPGPIKA